MSEKSILISQLKSLLDGEHNRIANLANASALLMQTVPEINWAGFYLLNQTNDELILGPFQGKVACMHIRLGNGVCGTSASQQKTIVVDDVHQFKGYIACDSAAQSELVIPLIKNSRLLGILDLDAPVKNRFDDQLTTELESFCQILVKMID